MFTIPQFTTPLIECIPNFSEGRNLNFIDSLIKNLKKIDTIHILDTNSSYYANRSVITFIGHPVKISEAIYECYKTATTLIDMRNHSGIHPRLGALDVCPIVPLSQVTYQDCQHIISEISPIIANDFQIPLFCYNLSALNLANRYIAPIRKGGYESLAARLNKEIFPDYGAKFYNAKFGAGFIGVRPPLIAYNVNLATNNTTTIKNIARHLRLARDKPKIKIGNHADLNLINNLSTNFSLNGLQAYGWNSNNFSQIAMNITDYKLTTPYTAYEAVRMAANHFQVKTGNAELVGLIPMEAVYLSLSPNNVTRISEANQFSRIDEGIKALNLDPKLTAEQLILEYKIKNALNAN